MLFSSQYNTILKDSRIEYKVNRSVFIAYCLKVKNQDEVNKRLKDVKNKYPDASHHCYAYVLNPDKSATHFNDDGEPGNTAGRPIQRKIQALDITNCLVVVVRYFGGKKLGIPGLIDAYGGSAALCLEKSGLQTKKIEECYEIESPYAIENEVFKLVKQLKGTVIDRIFTNKVFFKISIPMGKHEQVNTLKAKGIAVNCLGICS